ncbi:MAG: hypothetical protein AABX51_03820 [Nanoarchaeota archaeon]
MSEELSKHERKKLKKIERAHLPQPSSSKPRKGVPVSWLIAGGIVFAILFVSVIAAQLINAQPGKYDSFSKCLSEKGVVVYGNDWCQYTATQKEDFGKSFKYLNYKICDEIRPGCQQKGITITPSWDMNGTLLSGVQDLSILSELSGCPLP